MKNANNTAPSFNPPPAARKLREWRREKHLNQTEVAAMLDPQCQQKMISLYERGKAKPSLERAMRLAEISRGAVPLKDWKVEENPAKTELISVIDLAAQLGRRKQTIFKVLRRLEIEPIKAAGPNSRGALVAYVTDEEARLAREELAAQPDSEAFEEVGVEPNETGFPGQQGVFYLILLEPDHDPGRFKVGFAMGLPDRLRALRCSAPFAAVIKSWPCKILWEKTAIECVSHGCERLHTEVFRTDSIETVIAKCESFFGLMPKLSE